MSEVTVANVPVPAAPVDAGVREPFETFYHRGVRALVRLAVVVGDRQDQAEEVVQDSFAALYTRYPSVAAPLPYIRAAVLTGDRKVLRRRVLARKLLGHVPPD